MDNLIELKKMAYTLLLGGTSFTLTLSLVNTVLATVIAILTIAKLIKDLLKD